MTAARSRILTINVPHDPALHRKWPLMRFGFHGVGIAACWRGRIRGIGLLPNFRDGVA